MKKGDRIIFNPPFCVPVKGTVIKNLNKKLKRVLVSIDGMGAPLEVFAPFLKPIKEPGK
jgi:hypothetical protein